MLARSWIQLGWLLLVDEICFADLSHLNYFLHHSHLYSLMHAESLFNYEYCFISDFDVYISSHYDALYLSGLTLLMSKDLLMFLSNYVK